MRRATPERRSTPIARFELQLLWHRISVDGDDEAIERLRAIVPALRHPFEPVREQTYSIHRVDGVYVVEEEGDHLDSAADVDGAVDAVYVRAYRRAFELASLKGWVRVHAVTADVAGRRMLLVGPSGVGKTTLALHLLAAGEQVQGDESVLVRRGASMAVPRGFHVKRGGESAVPAFASIVAASPRAGDVAVVDPHRLAPETPLRVAPIDEIVLLGDDGSGITRWSPVDRAAVLQALIRESFVVTETKNALVGTLVDASGNAAGRSIIRGPLDAMSDALHAPFG